MSQQVGYYNEFGSKYKEAILHCPEPHLWTTDYEEKGRVYHEIKERIETQGKLVDTYFDTRLPVLDIGSGFGRQAFLLAEKGYMVTGTDTSDVFVAIAIDLFKKHNLKGAFLCLDIINEKPAGYFQQVLLLDVLEHIPPAQRKKFVQKINELMSAGGIMILSLPHIKKRLSSQVNNRIRKFFTQHLSFFRNREEHPYPIPQKNKIIKLTSKYFALVAFSASAETDYYVLKKH